MINKLSFFVNNHLQYLLLWLFLNYGLCELIIFILFIANPTHKAFQLRPRELFLCGTGLFFKKDTGFHTPNHTFYFLNTFAT